MARAGNSDGPRIYANGDRVFVEGYGGVIEAGILISASTEIDGFGYSHPRYRLTLTFADVRFHYDKDFSDIPKELAGTLSVIELFGVIDKKLTERENEA